MKILNINSFHGIFNGLFDFNQTITGADCYLNNEYLDINSTFWSYVLDEATVWGCINKLQMNANDYPISIQTILQFPSIFMERFSYVKKNIGKETNSAKKLFVSLETLQMACDLYYYAESKPFKLRVDSGFLRSCDSAKELKDDCLLPYCNPYLAFIEEFILPVLQEYQADIIWFSGRPNIGTFAIAKMVKRLFPNVVTGIINHTSEYYSLNKITSLLLNNHDFFEIFDVITLQYDLYTKKCIEAKLEKNKEWYCIPNIIYTSDHGLTITCNPVMEPDFRTVQISSDAKIPDITLFPENHCYWNQCSFCGINKKYIKNKNRSWNIDSAIRILEELEHKHISGFWAVDEAIPPHILSLLANKILERRMHFQWHVRTRIDSQLLNPKLCQALKDAGLKNILMGLESAVPRILVHMNKTNESHSYVETAELLVKQFNEAGISVHFPVIIGFPTETENEYKETLNFVEYLSETYPLFTYNVNILELDVSSYFYHHFEQFNISQLLYPCLPAHFIGNSIGWVCQYFPDNAEILYEAQKIALEKQFPWYPKNALLPIDSYFKLLEHTRLPLLNNSIMKNKQAKRSLDFHKDVLYLNTHCSFFKTSEGKYVFYNWETCHYIIGGEFFKIIYDKNKIYCSELLSYYSGNLQNEITLLLQTLFEFNILMKGGEINV